MSLDIIKRAQERMKQEIEAKTRTIEVPALGDENGPLVIYVRPLTSEEYDAIETTRKEKGSFHACIQTIIERARDADGNKLFSNSQRKEIHKWFRPPMILQLSSRINKDTQELFSEEALDTVKN